MGRFLRMANTVKLNRVRPNVIKLQLFPFSLRDTIENWFESLPYGSVNTWDELVEAFMGRFSLLLLLQRGGEKSLYSSKAKMKVSIIHGKGIRRCLQDVQCMGWIISHKWTFYTMP